MGNQMMKYGLAILICFSGSVYANDSVVCTHGAKERVISVVYDDNQDGINDDDLDQDNTLDTGTLIGSRKLIQITVQTPAGENIVFSMFRTNY